MQESEIVFFGFLLLYGYCLYNSLPTLTSAIFFCTFGIHRYLLQLQLLLPFTLVIYLSCYSRSTNAIFIKMSIINIILKSLTCIFFNDMTIHAKIDRFFFYFYKNIFLKIAHTFSEI